MFAYSQSDQQYYAELSSGVEPSDNFENKHPQTTILENTCNFYDFPSFSVGFYRLRFGVYWLVWCGKFDVDPSGATSSARRGSCAFLHSTLLHSGGMLSFIPAPVRSHVKIGLVVCGGLGLHFLRRCISYLCQKVCVDILIDLALGDDGSHFPASKNLLFS